MLHCLYRRPVFGHLDRPTDHVYPTPLEDISIIGLAPKFRWSEIVFAASPVWKGMTGDLFKETPYVEVLNAAIKMNVMTGRALAQTDQPQAVCIWTAVFFSLAKISKIIDGNLSETSKVVWCDTRE
jgi:hypothetical protein